MAVMAYLLSPGFQLAGPGIDHTGVVGIPWAPGLGRQRQQRRRGSQRERGQACGGTDEGSPTGGAIGRVVEIKHGASPSESFIGGGTSLIKGVRQPPINNPDS